MLVRMSGFKKPYRLRCEILSSPIQQAAKKSSSSTNFVGRGPTRRGLNSRSVLKKKPNQWFGAAQFRRRMISDALSARRLCQSLKLLMAWGGPSAAARRFVDSVRLSTGGTAFSYLSLSTRDRNGPSRSEARLAN